MKPPPGTYVRLESRSGLSFKHNIHVIGYVIAPDYWDNISVGLINHGNTPYIISKRDHIAQAVLEKTYSPAISIVDNLSTTTRDN